MHPDFKECNCFLISGLGFLHAFLHFLKPDSFPFPLYIHNFILPLYLPLPLHITHTYSFYSFIFIIICSSFIFSSYLLSIPIVMGWCCNALIYPLRSLVRLKSLHSNHDGNGWRGVFILFELISMYISMYMYPHSFLVPEPSWFPGPAGDIEQEPGPVHPRPFPPPDIIYRTGRRDHFRCEQIGSSMDSLENQMTVRKREYRQLGKHHPKNRTSPDTLCPVLGTSCPSCERLQCQRQEHTAYWQSGPFPQNMLLHCGFDVGEGWGLGKSCLIDSDGVLTTHCTVRNNNW